jgi:hypothetical protein
VLHSSKTWRADVTAQGGQVVRPRKFTSGGVAA